jgi:hypothetical protein
MNHHDEHVTQYTPMEHSIVRIFTYVWVTLAVYLYLDMPVLDTVWILGALILSLIVGMYHYITEVV